MWKLQFTNGDKQRPVFSFIRSVQQTRKLFFFFFSWRITGWLIALYKQDSRTINHHVLDIHYKRNPHYTGSFRICAALWGTFIIFFISKSFLCSRHCGKWVTFISLQIQIFSQKKTVHASERLELFHSRGHSSYSISGKCLEGCTSWWNLMKSAHSEVDANARRSRLGCGSPWKAINVQLQHEICTKAQMWKYDTNHEQSAPITVVQSNRFVLSDTGVSLYDFCLLKHERVIV